MANDVTLCAFEKKKHANVKTKVRIVESDSAVNKVNIFASQ